MNNIEQIKITTYESADGGTLTVAETSNKIILTFREADDKNELAEWLHDELLLAIGFTNKEYWE